MSIAQYMDEFDEACITVANGEDLPVSNLRTRIALMALCRMALQARLEYAMIREIDERGVVNLGASSFKPIGENQ